MRFILLKYHLYMITLIVLGIMFSGVQAQVTLKDAFKDLFLIGTALNYSQLKGDDPESMKIIKQHFNSITAENSMKWEQIHPGPEKYEFKLADSLVAIGARNNMAIIGHTLIWHAQTPDWVFNDDSGNELDRDKLLHRMKEYIFTVVGRYKGKVFGWDVVNEAFEDNGSLRKSKWLKIIGEDYIQRAFEYVHQADPETELYYNDFNMWKEDKCAAVINMIKAFKANNIPIHGIGFQGHWGTEWPTNDSLYMALESYAETGVPIMITELDLNILPMAFDYFGADITKRAEMREDLDPYKEGLPDSMQIVFNNRYLDFFKAFIKYHNSISRITFWGVHDGISWLNNWPVHGRTAYPLLFDRDYQLKPVINELIKLVKKPE
ncbi:MAG: endo-1,4-beta-xylanase [Calditrichaceae bacterium]|nr:endo-1,4-beta-xylanase [Calditrichaceae bacterium]MBN2709606.1 endo-1,4-beta-xylanase [Calditrichaceae bacterium]RQV92403.1 MAG: endo-1,4-beta-xylanase [Calditrichota bacterium]